MTRRLIAVGSLAAIACAATPALAHPGHPGHEVLGAWAGFSHPFSGYDHLLAMVAVGLWASLRGGRALIAWPAGFLAAMAAGLSLGAPDPALVEAAVLASVVVLGLVTAANLRGWVIGLAVVAAAGVLHGMAHAGDIGQASPSFAAGMLLATALLHATGLGLGWALRRLDRRGLVRLIGAGVAACGVLLAVAG